MTMRGIAFIGFLISTQLLSPPVKAQNQMTNARLAFYNAENFFDPYPDTTVNYTEFNPGGNHHWTMFRYQNKLQHIFKVVAALGEWNGIAVMGFSEIENRKVLEDLTNSTPLQKFHYKIIHFDSPDNRGIDVGIIYQPSYFQPLFSQAIRVSDQKDSLFRTRDILYVKGLLMGDTLNIFINHWPSRYSGLLQSQPKRLLAARILKKNIDSICKKNPGASILVLGDMNENPQDPAIQTLIQAHGGCKLHALLAHSLYGWAKGSIKSKGRWSLFDQMLVSSPLLNNTGNLSVQNKSFHIFDAPFLLEKDKKYMGLKANRSFVGFKYHGGFSDHLPVFVDLIKQNK